MLALRVSGVNEQSAQQPGAIQMSGPGPRVGPSAASSAVSSAVSSGAPSGVDERPAQHVGAAGASAVPKSAAGDERGATVAMGDTGDRGDTGDTVDTVELGWLDVGPLDVAATWSAMRRGGGDPTYATARVRASAGVTVAIWKAWQTPDGAVTVRVDQCRAGAPVRARAWGPGAGWVARRLPAMLGVADDPTGFAPRHALLRAAASRFAGLRVPATGLVVEALVPSIIEQRVTGAEAFTSYRRLVRRFGAEAPGPAGARGLLVAPSVAGWQAIPSWEWLRAGVDPGRSDTIMRALRRADALERCVGLPPAAARARLSAVPGVGGWTAAEVAHISLGDADAVSFGDYHVAKDVGLALAGVEVDDRGLERLLEPYLGHRYRVQRLVELAGARRERHGARRSLPTHLPTRW